MNYRIIAAKTHVDFNEPEDSDDEAAVYSLGFAHDAEEAKRLVKDDMEAVIQEDIGDWDYDPEDEDDRESIQEMRDDYNEYLADLVELKDLRVIGRLSRSDDDGSLSIVYKAIACEPAAKKPDIPDVITPIVDFLKAMDGADSKKRPEKPAAPIAGKSKATQPAKRSMSECVKGISVDWQTGVVKLKFSDGRTTSAKCHPQDDFDLTVGISLCFTRWAFGDLSAAIEDLLGF